MRVDEIIRIVYTNLRLDEPHRKSSHRDSAGTSTETTAHGLRDGRSLPRRSFETPVFYWTEKQFSKTTIGPYPGDQGKVLGELGRDR